MIFPVITTDDKYYLSWFAHHFARELGLEGIPYHIENNPEDCHLFIYDFAPVGGVVFFGCGDAWTLDWVWIEPEYRRKGILRGAWPILKQRYGNFAVSEPHSDSMVGFLSSLTSK